MVKHIITTKNFLVYNPNNEQSYNVELEIDHTNLDEESIAIIDSNGFEVEDDELFSEIEMLWENFYNNNIDLVDNDE
jgi:hypothetical protein